MNEKHITNISKQLNLGEDNVTNTIDLLEGGATIPFISRYRKEMTGSLDEVAILAIKKLLEKLVEIDKRRETIIHSIEEQGKMTVELKERLENTRVLSELENIYLPYKPKRKTRAGIAKENGLEPLAAIIIEQKKIDLELKIPEFFNEKIKSAEETLQGARDIIAEWVNENQDARNTLRKIFSNEAVIYSKVIKGKEPDGIKYGDYYDYREPLKRCPSHRYLAIRRGEEEGFLRISIEPDEKKAIQALNKIFIKSSKDRAVQVERQLPIHIKGFWALR